MLEDSFPWSEFFKDLLLWPALILFLMGMTISPDPQNKFIRGLSAFAKFAITLLAAYSFANLVSGIVPDGSFWTRDRLWWVFVIVSTAFFVRDVEIKELLERSHNELQRQKDYEEFRKKFPEEEKSPEQNNEVIEEEEVWVKKPYKGDTPESLGKKKKELREKKNNS